MSLTPTLPTIPSMGWNSPTTTTTPTFREKYSSKCVQCLISIMEASYSLGVLKLTINYSYLAATSLKNIRTSFNRKFKPPSPKYTRPPEEIYKYSLILCQSWKYSISGKMGQFIIKSRLMLKALTFVEFIWNPIIHTLPILGNLIWIWVIK